MKLNQEQIKSLVEDTRKKQDIEIAMKLSNIKGAVVFGSVPRSILSGDFIWNDIDIIIEDESLIIDVIAVIMPMVRPGSQLLILSPQEENLFFSSTHAFKIEIGGYIPSRIDVLIASNGRNVMDVLREMYEMGTNITANFNILNFGSIRGLDSFTFADAKNRKIRAIGNNKVLVKKVHHLVSIGWTIEDKSRLILPEEREQTRADIEPVTPPPNYRTTLTNRQREALTDAVNQLRDQQQIPPWTNEITYSFETTIRD